MAIKLHRCGSTALRGPHHCWKVQQALDQAGIEYEVVKHPTLPRGRRKAYIALTGQRWLPAIEFEDGSILREDSEQLVERISSGRLRGSLG
jgi:glutathione S-transferase